MNIINFYPTSPWDGARVLMASAGRGLASTWGETCMVELQS
jgi:hypothetical protein